MADAMQNRTPGGWKDYELIDCGAFQKLERFGNYVVARPEPQAIWEPSLDEKTWRERADAVFEKSGVSEGIVNDRK